MRCLHLYLEFANRELTQTKINQYLKARYYHLNPKGKYNKPTTKNLEIISIRSLIKFLKITDLNLELIKEPNHNLPQNILTKSKLLKLFKLPNLKTTKGFRDRTMLEILYATGIRRAELANLETSDFKQAQLLIKNGKGQKDRFVPLNQTAINFLNDYLKNHRPKLKPKSNHIFLSLQGRQFCIKALNLLFKPYLKKINPNITIHTLRHTLATHLIQNNMPLRHVQELLGHKKLDTTIKYLHLNIKDLKKEFNRCHPLEKLVE